MDAKTDVKKNISKRVETRITQFTQNTGKSNVLFDLAQKRITLMKAQGKDTQDVNSALQDCQQLLQEGNQNLQDAKNKFVQMENLDRDQEEQGAQIMNDGIKMIRTARATYNQARQNCSKVMQELRILK